ncbi:MAG: integrase catalytic domain-containing protein [Leadbetterella sp.]|nr:integrase catalytic domain-containing protein [Leadbetterella sp.]
MNTKLTAIGYKSNSKPRKASKLGINFFERGPVLYIRLTYEGQKLEKSLGVTITPGTLFNKTQTIKGDDAGSALIQSIKAEIEQNASKARVIDSPIILESILQLVLSGKGIIDCKPTFQNLLGLAFNEAKAKYTSGKIKSEKTFKRYEKVYSDVLNYFERTVRNPAIRLEDISFYDASRMIEYFQTAKGFEPETIRKRLEFGKRAYEIARQKKLQEHNPFQGHKLPRAKNYAKNHLSEPELNNLAAFVFETPAYHEIRDFFAFQCLTSLNYCDLEALLETEIVETDRGPAISQQRSKTGTEVFIPLLPLALDILNRYRGRKPRYCFPIPTNQHYNRVLKEIAAIVKIKKPLTSSFARKTFCNLAFDKGMDVDSMGVIVGHKTAKMAYKYYLAKQAPNRAFDAMEALKSKLK